MPTLTTPATFADWLKQTLDHLSGDAQANVNFAAILADVLVAEVGPGRHFSLVAGIDAVLLDADHVFLDEHYRAIAVRFLSLIRLLVPDDAAPAAGARPIPIS